MFIEGQYPDLWKQAQMTPIPKVKNRSTYKDFIPNHNQLIWLSGSMSASGPAGCGFKSQSVPKVIVTLTDHTVPSDQDFK